MKNIYKNLYLISFLCILFYRHNVIFQSNPSSLTVVRVIYNTLASILGVVNVTANTSGSGIFLLPGSQIISTTVKPLDSERFTEPVRIRLENNGSVGHFVYF